MNRNSKDNLVIPLGPTFQMQVREPYLIFRMDKNDEKESQKIRGIWFHDGKERQTIVDILNRVVKILSTGMEEVVPPIINPSPQNASKSHIDKKEAAASLMNALKIGGSDRSGSDSASVPRQVQDPTSLETLVLDKKSLQLSLMSLLQEDKFLDLIHAQYLKVAKARASGDASKK